MSSRRRKNIRWQIERRLPTNSPLAWILGNRRALPNDPTARGKLPLARSVSGRNFRGVALAWRIRSAAASLLAAHLSGRSLGALFLQKGVDRSKLSWKKPGSPFSWLLGKYTRRVWARWCAPVCPVHGHVPRACQLQYDKESGASALEARVCTRRRKLSMAGALLWRFYRETRRKRERERRTRATAVGAHRAANARRPRNEERAEGLGEPRVEK